MRKAQIRETLLYIWFGICTTAINFIVFYLCHVILGIELIASNSIAWIFAVLFAFVTNRGIVFQSKGNLTRQAVSFLPAECFPADGKCFIISVITDADRHHAF